MTAPVVAPFEVRDSTLITRALGQSARDLVELRDGVARAPTGCIHHHFFHTLLRHTFDDPEYRNDFALWARRQLHDFHLAERLDVIDPIDHDDIEELRARVIGILDGRIRELDHAPSAAPDRRFHFLSSQLVVFSTPLRAETPEALAAIIPRLTTGSVFFHFVEARRRRPGRLDDFSRWLAAWGEGSEAVRRRLASVDYWLWTLTEMRDLLRRCFESGGEAEVRP